MIHFRIIMFPTDFNIETKNISTQDGKCDLDGVFRNICYQLVKGFYYRFIYFNTTAWA